MRWLGTIAAVGIVLAARGGVAWAGALIFYPTRTAFDAAEPGLPVQRFASANLSGQPYVTQASPLTPSTNDSVFAKGSILPGLRITTLAPGSVATALIVYAGGPVGGVSVGNNWFGDTLILRFRRGVAAVAEDVFGNTSQGPSFTGRINEQVYSGSTLLGGRTFQEAAGGSVFIGISSATLAITAVRITWASDGDATTYVSNVAFGTPGVP